jgi:hypothetical protein
MIEILLECHSGYAVIIGIETNFSYFAIPQRGTSLPEYERSQPDFALNIHICLGTHRFARYMPNLQIMCFCPS